MAERDLKLHKNIPGRYYVDSSCIDCDLCRQIAPDNFARDEDDTYMSYIFRQPIGEAEIELVQEAVDSCPSNSIGVDGVEASFDTEAQIER